MTWSRVSVSSAQRSRNPPEGINECTWAFMEGALLLLGGGLPGFWNRLFTVVFSGGAETGVNDPGTWLPSGARVVGSQQGHGQAWCLCKGLPWCMWAQSTLDTYWGLPASVPMPLRL